MSKKISLILGLAGAVGMVVASPSVSWAATFKFSFADVMGTVSGLSDDGANQQATSVILTDDGGVGIPTPLETIGFAVTNLWTVVGGEIEAITYITGDLPPAGGVDILTLSKATGVEGTGILNNSSTGQTQSGPLTFTPQPIPESSSLLGLGLVAGLGIWAKKTKVILTK